MTEILYSHVEKAARWSKRFSDTKHFQEDLLHHVFHIFAAAKNTAHQREDALLMTPDQFLESGFLAALSQSD